MQTQSLHYKQNNNAIIYSCPTNGKLTQLTTKHARVKPRLDETNGFCAMSSLPPICEWTVRFLLMTTTTQRAPGTRLKLLNDAAAYSSGVSGVWCCTAATSALFQHGLTVPGGTKHLDTFVCMWQLQLQHCIVVYGARNVVIWLQAVANCHTWSFKCHKLTLEISSNQALLLWATDLRWFTASLI